MNNALEILPPESPSALEAIEKAQIDTQVATAHRFPRTLSKVKADMLSFATIDEDTAQSCFYTLPRGGKTIQGPSVRLAEIAIASYGNLRIGARPIATVTTGDNPHVVVQAVCHDLEKNVAISIEKRRRITKKKSKDAIDEDDINLAVNACSAIALRDATFKVVPLALIKPVYEEAKKVAIGDVKSLGAKRTKVIERLTQMGAKIENILARVEAKKIEDIDLSKLEVLIGLGTALKDGDTSLEDAFPVAQVEVKKPVFDTPEQPDAKKKATTKKEEQKNPEVQPAAVPAPAAPETPAPEQPANETAAEPPTETPPSDSPFKYVDQLQDKMLDDQVNEKAFLDWAIASKYLPEGTTSTAKIPEMKAAMFVNNWAKITEALKKGAHK